MKITSSALSFFGALLLEEIARNGCPPGTAPWRCCCAISGLAETTDHDRPDVFKQHGGDDSALRHNLSRARIRAQRRPDQALPPSTAGPQTHRMKKGSLAAPFLYIFLLRMPRAEPTNLRTTRQASAIVALNNLVAAFATSTTITQRLGQQVTRKRYGFSYLLLRFTELYSILRSQAICNHSL